MDSSLFSEYVYSNHMHQNTKPCFSNVFSYLLQCEPVKISTLVYSDFTYCYMLCMTFTIYDVICNILILTSLLNSILHIPTKISVKPISPNDVQVKFYSFSNLWYRDPVDFSHCVFHGFLFTTGEVLNPLNKSRSGPVHDLCGVVHHGG